MNRIFCKNIIAGFLFCLLVTTTYAGQPFLSDDPSIENLGTAQYFLFSKYNNNPANSTLGFPGVTFEYGMISNIELDINTEHAYTVKTGIPRTEGMGDTSVEIKYQFIHETATMPAIAFAPIYNFPSGNATLNLGNGRSWYQLPIWLQKSWKQWTTYGGGGYAINPAPGQNNFFYGGWVIQNHLTKKLNLGGEIFSAGNQSSTNTAFTLLNLGIIYQFNAYLNFYCSAGKSLWGQNQVIAYLGAAITLG